MQKSGAMGRGRGVVIGQLNNIERLTLILGIPVQLSHMVPFCGSNRESLPRERAHV